MKRPGILLAILLALAVLPVGVFAAPPDDGGQVYVVQADDWLSKLADKFYGDPLAYPLIFEATNAQAAQDAGFAPIADPNLIEVGQKLFIPAMAQPGVELAQAVPETESLMPEEAVNVHTNPGPTARQQQLLASLAVKGAPPELFNEVWLNSEPLKLADLRGKVVIVEFWTFG